ncbi:RluA family pseudouridine synthase [Peptostreptococcus anaerobius]|uniref:RNA pseudouridylate synthase n=1 Tax=Peptostreptococcus porci TaxID=2652282 RepID=A0A6N7XGQ9_9FIRM|nr:RluA family pseudouridine synthase [Peptostreptococcus porci]MDD7182189.1 RluA family pseudouridine synthase [Peptostreptococcus porci]MDY4128364.1 RluA family pseudouridine synthase [Peptostreptococcus porci]MDY5964468.1 RluA family pseudouridine synthase [Peptostreptococcus porci]MST62783.1 RluA family pseudouridine synthase [Peptostreptococcus porci]
MSRIKLNVIYEDNHLLVVEKVRNILSQADNTEDLDMINICKDYIKEKYNKPGNVYLGLVHRLDRPVGGVMVFAKTSKAASRLSDQIRRGLMNKTYRAVIVGNVEKEGYYEDYLQKNKKTNIVRVVDKNTKDAKLAKLSFEKISSCKNNEKEVYSLVEIDLMTGRPHQIRVQFSSRGIPLYGDQRYSKYSSVGQQIALWSTRLEFIHPTTKEKMTFELLPPNEYPWNIF